MPIKFETTLSGLSYLQKIKRWQALSYQVKLWFLSLPSGDLAVSRVAQRVKQGGHNIPVDVIRRRFKAGLKTLTNIIATQLILGCFTITLV
jgi:predicted ABC-type ATPase